MYPIVYLLTRDYRGSGFSVQGLGLRELRPRNYVVSQPRAMLSGVVDGLLLLNLLVVSREYGNI